MRLALDPFRLLLISLAGWLNRQQQDIIDYLQEENRVLREQLRGKRVWFSDDQRRRLAVKAQKVGRRVLHELATLVAGDALGTSSSSPANTMAADSVVLDRRRHLIAQGLMTPLVIVKLKVVAKIRSSPPRTFARSLSDSRVARGNRTPAPSQNRT
jgi:hypothetical protein